MKPEKLIGKLVKITDMESIYFNHWGFILDWDGEVFHVSGGSIATDDKPNVIPIFDRDQFIVPKKSSYNLFRGAGAKIDDKGYKI